MASESVELRYEEAKNPKSMTDLSTELFRVCNPFDFFFLKLFSCFMWIHLRERERGGGGGGEGERGREGERGSVREKERIEIDRWRD